LVGPRELWPPDDVVATVRQIAEASGSEITLTDDIDEGVAGVDVVHTDVWVSMGESKEVWDERVSLLRPYQVNATLMKRTGNPKAKFMHCLPAFHAPNTTVG